MQWRPIHRLPTSPPRPRLLGPLTLPNWSSTRASSRHWCSPASPTYLSAHQVLVPALQNAVKKSPQQWQHWFWVDVAGMVIFIPTIWLIGGPWSPGRAKRDAEEHDRAVEDELARILKDDPSPSPA